MLDAKKERESAFHNARFSAETEPRRAFAPIYRLMLPANLLYHQTVEGFRGMGRVLEYGCGHGENALTFARRGLDITGIDISEAGVARGKAQAARVGLPTRFMVMDAEHLDFADNTFAAVIGKGILHHLDIEAAYREIARVLEPNGRAVFIEPLGHSPLINWFRRRTSFARTPDERPLLMNDLDGARAHFKRVDLTFFNLTTLAAAPFKSEKVFTPLFSLFGAVDTLLFRAFPRIARYAWMVFMDMRGPIKDL